MDGGDKSRSPRRSTLLEGAIFADNAGAGVATGITGDACIGGAGGAAADSNG